MDYLYSYRLSDSKLSGFEKLSKYDQPIKFAVKRDSRGDYLVVSSDIKRPSNSLLKFIKAKAKGFTSTFSSSFIARYPVIGDRIYKIEINKV